MLDDRLIVITGAGGRLGSQFAMSLMKYGATVALVDSDHNALDILADKLENHERYLTCCVDITKESEVAKFSSDLRSKFDGVYGLINNAALNPKFETTDNRLSLNNALENFSLDQWQSSLSVCLTGSFFMVKHLLPLFRVNPEQSVVLNIASDLALIAPDHSIYNLDELSNKNRFFKPVSYSVAKSGLLGFSRYLATYEPETLRSNAVCFGGVAEGNQDSRFVSALCKKIPLKRQACVEEYNDTVLYLMSDASAYMNGSTVVIDGGRTIW